MTTIPGLQPIVIGLGCSSAADAPEIIALVDPCLAEAGLDATRIAAFATHVRKRESRALAQAASHFDVPLRFLDDDDLAYAGTAEPAASAAGTLILGKRKSHYATCAIALAAPGFTPSHFGQPASPSAAIASSTLATSLAGP